MQTRLSLSLLETDWGKEADSILRTCVHCGFCTATCPTYQLTGDELDGPRGRIYLIKQALEESKSDIGWGSQIRSYVLDQSRIKDLRTSVETSNTQAVLDGDLDQFIEASLKSGL